MSTLKERPNTALLVVDVQNSVVERGYQRDAVIANIATLVDKARAEAVPVVWVQQKDEHLVEGSQEWQIVPELHRRESDPLVQKSYGDSFEATALSVNVR